MGSTTVKVTYSKEFAKRMNESATKVGSIERIFKHKNQDWRVVNWGNEQRTMHLVTSDDLTLIP